MIVFSARGVLFKYSSTLRLHADEGTKMGWSMCASVGPLIGQATSGPTRGMCVSNVSKLSFQGWVRCRMNYYHSYIADHTGAVSRSQSIRNQKNIIKNKSEIRSILKMKNEKRTLPSSSCDPHPCLAPRNRLMASESFFLFFGYPWETPLQRYAWSFTPEYSIARHAQLERSGYIQGIAYI